jgi:hypothetical protein
MLPDWQHGKLQVEVEDEVVGLLVGDSLEMLEQM